jgi:hypothetical protein
MPREHERVPFLVEIVLESSSGKREARISDISMGGCYVDSIATVRDGEAVAFDLVHPSGQRLPFTGTVSYVLEGFGFGVRFTDLTDEQTVFLTRIVRLLGG